jgi:hypothetical protein
MKGLVKKWYGGGLKIAIPIGQPKQPKEPLKKRLKRLGKTLIEKVKTEFGKIIK